MVDATNDISEPKENWANRSSAFIIDILGMKFLNYKGEWVKGQVHC
ncbi:MAG: hypothetical protein HDT22_05175 [Ruminococcus sp.]|nr:hypothetical protein [Ruminococcus sp.]